MSSSASSVRRSRGDGIAGECRKLTSAPLVAAMRRAISFVWKRPSISSKAAIAGIRRTPCSGGKCREPAISAIVLPHETASASPGPELEPRDLRERGLDERVGAPSAGTTTTRRSPSAERSASDRSSGADGRRISMCTIPSSRASWSSRETVERDTPSRSATSCWESWSR